MDQSIIQPPSDDDRIAALRESVLGPQVETSIHGDVGVKVTSDQEEKPSYSSVPAPEEVLKAKEPLAMDHLLSVLNKKRIPYTIVYLTEGPNRETISNFATTMGGGAHAVELVKHIVDENSTRFGE